MMRGVRTMRMAVLVAGIALTVSGCGGEVVSDIDPVDITATVEDWSTALADGDGEVACEMATKDLREVLIADAESRGLPADGCAVAIASLAEAGVFEPATGFTEPELPYREWWQDRPVSAHVIVSYENVEDQKVVVSRREGEWRVSQAGDAPEPT